MAAVQTPWTPRSLGTDFALGSRGLEVGTAGSLVTVSGFANLAAALLRRWNTPLGSHDLHPEYGSRLHEFLQADVDADALVAMAMAVEEAAELDPRVATCSAVASLDPMTESEVVIEVAVTPVNAVNPFNLTLRFDLETLTVAVVRDGVRS